MDTSDFVRDELARRQKVRQDRNDKRQGDGGETMDMDLALKGEKWKEMHMQLAASCHCPSFNDKPFQKQMFTCKCVIACSQFIMLT